MAVREISYADAGMQAFIEEMGRDEKIFHLSTDAPPPLVEKFGASRVRGTAIAEGALTGMAIGAAGSGFRPIIDWRMVTFSFVAMDLIVNQASKIHYMFGGQTKFPILYRCTVGGGVRMAAQHSQSPYSMFMNLAGLKMILPATPYDTKGLLKSAIRDDNPVISFESTRLLTLMGEVPEEEYTIPLGVADIKREGSDVTIVALACGASAEIAALVTEDPTTFKTLKAAIRRVCALQVPIPYSPTLEDHVFPDRHKIAIAARDVMSER